MSSSSAPLEFWQNIEDHLVERVVARLRETASQPTDLITSLEASRVLGVAERTLLRWADEGCPCTRLPSGRRRWQLSEIQSWLESRGGAR